MINEVCLTDRFAAILDRSILARRILFMVVVIIISPSLAYAQADTAFTYQGDLQQDSMPANGAFDFNFSLWDAHADGNQIEAMKTISDVDVVNGRFLVELNFGANVFNASPRWLQIQVNGVILSPRQRISRTPYAIQTRGLAVDDDLNIGIGTNNPTRQLELASDVESAIRLMTTSGNAGDVSRLEFKSFDAPGIFTPLGTIDFIDENDSRMAFIQATKVAGNTAQMSMSVAPAQNPQITITENETQISGDLNIAGSSAADTLIAANGNFEAVSTQTLTVDNDIGIGLANPVARVHAVGSNSENVILGINNDDHGAAYGVAGHSSSSSGHGVFGWATSSTGVAYGVYGISASDDGSGVNGFSSDGIGVTGSSINFRGVYGTSVDGNGVYGETSSSEASGVIGVANNGNATGVRGVSNSPKGFGVFSFGDFGGTGAKYFVQPHPYAPSKEIRFVSLEGNESGTYFRGSSRLENGRCYILVPEEFRLVTEPQGLTVQVTAMGPSADLWIEAKSLDEIIVRGDRDVDFDYFVNGIRLGFQGMQLIHENHKFRPEFRGVPYGNQLREEQRQLLVDNGILNQDFTPNEQTAERLGWSLRDPKNPSSDSIKN